MNAGDVNAGTETRRQSDDPADIAADFKALALDAAGGLIDMAFDNAGRDLLEMNADADYDPEVFAACEVAIRLARDERARLTVVFIQVLGESLSGHGETSEPGDQALLPEDEAEEAARASRIAGRLIADCADELEPLEARLATLADSADISSTAVSPTALCQSFRQAMQTVVAPPTPKHMLYGLFERTLDRQLGSLYQSLDAELVKRGVAAKPQRTLIQAALERPPQSAQWARQLNAARRVVAPENEFSAGEIRGALVALSDRVGAWRSPHKLLDALIKHLRRRQRDTTPRALPARARRQLGLTMAWWHDLYVDPAVPTPAKPMLEQLRLILLEIALFDEGLFRDPDNPARRMINELINLARPDETRVWERANILVGRVVVAFEVRPGVVTAAAKALARRRQSTRDAAMAKSRRMAALELQQQALGRTPPENVRPFLLKGWAPLLARAYLEGGGAGPSWYTAVSRLSRLLDLVQPPTYGSDREARVRAQRGLAREVRAQLLDGGVPRRRVSAFVRALQEAFAEANQSEAVSLSEIESFDNAAAWHADITVFDDSGDYAIVGASPEEAVEGATAEPLPSSTVDSVLETACKPGRWFQLSAGDTGDTGGTRWLRVAGYDAKRGVVTFGNRRGEIVYERPAADFAEDLRVGRSRPIYDAEDFEAKLAAIIGEQARDADPA